MRLLIGNKTYSSWSMRAWLVAKASGLEFEEVCIDIYSDEVRERLKDISPSGLVPVLEEDHLTVWDTLAIAEYLHEKAPDASLWPQEMERRAWARSVSAEMHAGFAALRQELPMHLRKTEKRAGISEEVKTQIQRISEVWTQCREANRSRGDYLFGDFSISDAMYAPVVTRFHTYGVELEGPAKDYATAILAHPLVREWYAGAEQEGH